MQLFTTSSSLKEFVSKCLSKKQTIGFVPTMGALHSGHISLINKALAENDVVICSIYVNPTQFNNTEDLEKYPRTLAKDLSLLEKVNCTAVFNPESDQLYPDGLKSEEFDFGHLENIMEGKYRPGHFKGMATVVKRLLEATTPHKAYFGEKDFQQLAVIAMLVANEKLAVEIIGCPIARELDGLAMSSRNIRLNTEQRHAAPRVYQALINLKERAKLKDFNRSLAKAIEDINSHPHLAVEYLEIVDTKTLKPLNDWNEAESAMAFVAVLAGEVRLIDNILLY